MSAAIAILLSIIAGWSIQRASRKWHEPPDEETDEETADFDLATVSEKFEIAHETNKALDDMEQLLTDLDTCTTDRQTVVQIRWLGDDGENHEHDLYCDGMNTATECLREIAEREAHDLRRLLAYQCQTLAGATRGRKIGGKNRRKARGEC